MNQIFYGNAMDVLECDIGCFDAVISDPPYASGATLSTKQSSTAKKIHQYKAAMPLS